MLEDDELRRDCLTDFDMLACVEAAAGTGKTSLMAGRVAMMLADGLPASKIAALSFTEAAASELSRRIHGVIDTLLNGKVPPELASALPDGRLSDMQSANLANAINELDELTSCTIHSFCQSIIVDHGVSAGLDPGAATADEGVAEFLFEEAFSNWLVDTLSSGHPEDDVIVAFVEDVGQNPVERLKKLASFWRERRSASFAPVDLSRRHDIDLVDAIDALVRWTALHPHDVATNSLAEGVAGLRGHFENCFGAAVDFRGLLRLSRPPRAFGMKEGSFEFLPFEKVETWASTRVTDRETLRSEAHALYNRVTNAFADVMGQVAGSLALKISAPLVKVLQRYDEAKRNAAVMDFDDLLVHARDLLRAPDDRIRQEVGQRYRYILVDEYQDTNLVQTEILFSICATTRVQDWRSAVLAPGSLFLVGDPKQAIYHFRQADIATYNMAKDVIAAQEGGRLIPITANFRSRKPIIEYVNSCFAPVFSTPGQPRYVELKPTIANTADGVQCVAKLSIKGRGKWKLCAEESKQVADLCQQIIGRLPVRRSNGEVGVAAARDIALLAADYRDLWRYERELERLGIPVTSHASKALMGRQETQDVVALLRTLADPSDTLAFGALLRGPLIGISDQVLLNVMTALTEQGSPYGLSIRTQPASIPDPYVRSVVEALQGLRLRSMTVPPSQLLAEALDVLKARLVITWRHRSRYARALANLEALVDMGRQYSTAGLQTFAREIQKRWEGKTITQEGRGDTSDDAVQVVTMHSSKGLEWPVIIPVGTANNVFGPPLIIHRRSDNTIHWTIGGVASPEAQRARAEETEADQLEKQRMWYVVSTRARDLLVLPEMAGSDDLSWAKVVPHPLGGLPEIDLTALPVAATSSPTREENGQDATIFAAQQKLIVDSAPPVVWAQPSAHDKDRPLAVLDMPETFETVPGWVAPIGAGRTRGSIIHKLIEEILTGEQAGERTVLADRARLLQSQMLSIAEPGDDAELAEPDEMAATALLALVHVDIAPLRGLIVPEVSVWGRDGEYFVAGRADALVIRNQKVLGVLDWKSDVAVTAETRARYLQQVLDYVELTGAIAGAVVFASTGEVLWVGDRAGLYASVRN